MKKFVKRTRPDDGPGTRTGPRARAAQERKYSDPYSRVERPAGPPRAAGFDRGEGGAERSPGGRPAVVTLDPDVARVFRDSQTVNEVLRMVMRLARFAGSRPAFTRDRPATTAGGERRAAPRPDRAERRPPRPDRPERRPPRPKGPRFREE